MRLRLLTLAGWLASIAAGPAAAQGTPAMLLGSPAQPADASRTITIAPDTRWVNATQGEVIRFVVGGTEFSWRFDGAGGRTVDLQQVAPPGLIVRPVLVYLARPLGMGTARP